jgi:hypothetical protein
MRWDMDATGEANVQKDSKEDTMKIPLMRRKHYVAKMGATDGVTRPGEHARQQVLQRHLEVPERGHWGLDTWEEHIRQQALQRHLDTEESAEAEKLAESVEETLFEQESKADEDKTQNQQASSVGGFPQTPGGGGDQQQAKPQPGVQLYPGKLSDGGGMLKELLSLTGHSSSDGSSCQLPNGASWCTVKPATGRNFEMAVYSGHKDIVSDSICANGQWEVSDVSYLGTPGTALDIGANLGFYSFLLADAGWQVESVEALPKNQELIKATACRNPHLAEKITLHSTGLVLQTINVSLYLAWTM